MAAQQRREPTPQVLTDVPRMIHELLALEHLEHRDTRRRCDRIAAERREEPVLGLKRLDELPSGDHHPHRESIADGLAQRDDVRIDAAALEAPEMRSGASQAV